MPRAARFCPECGRPAGSQDEVTVIEEVPVDETGPVPVHLLAVEPRYFGVAPATAVLVLAAAALGAAVFLLATGHVLPGGLLLGAGLILLLLFVAAARVRADSAVARVSAGAAEALRARAGFAVETLAAQGSARVEFFRLRRELVDLAARRAYALQALGEAVYREDEDAADEARAAVRALDGEIAQREGRMHTIVEHAQERISQARLEIQPTEIRTPEAFDPPGPAQVPEPAPVPSQPIEPPLIPEPVPEPSPPVEPPMIPEPTPAPTEPAPGAAATEHGKAS